VEVFFAVRNPLPLEGDKLTSVIFWVFSYAASISIGRFIIQGYSKWLSEF